MMTYGKIFLRALEEFDMEQCREWRNDENIYKWCRQNDLITRKDQEEWYERQRKDQRIRMYAICSAGDDTLLGVCGLTDIDLINSRAEFSCYIGPEFQRCGYANDALIALFNYGFNTLNLNCIWGETFEGNYALSLFTKLGMTIDGVRRAFYFKNGEYIDCTLVSLLRHEWKF